MTWFVCDADAARSTAFLVEAVVMVVCAMCVFIQCMWVRVQAWDGIEDAVTHWSSSLRSRRSLNTKNSARSEFATPPSRTTKRWPVQSRSRSSSTREISTSANGDAKSVAMRRVTSFMA